MEQAPKPTSPEEEFARFSERKRICDAIGKDTFFAEDLLAAVSAIPETDLDRRSWNTPFNYVGLVTKLLPFLTRDHHEAFLSATKEALEENGTRKANPSAFAAALTRRRVCAGIKVAEIGGTFLREFLGRLGATVHGQDSGFDIRTTAVLVDPKQIVTIKNFSSLFPAAGTYDAVCTNNVFTTGSGLAEANRRGGANHDELLLIEHALVREGGIIANVVSENQPKKVERSLHGSTSAYEAYAATHPKSITWL